MSRTSTLIALGVITLVTPFSGLPMGLRSLITALCGASVLAIGLMQRARDTRVAVPPPEVVSTPPATPPSGISPI